MYDLTWLIPEQRFSAVTLQFLDCRVTSEPR